MGGFHADALSRTKSRDTPRRSSSARRRRSGRSVIDDCRHGRLREVLPRRRRGRRSTGLRPDRSHLPRQALPADRPRRGRARLPLQVRVLRRADRCSARRRRAGRSTRSSPRSRAITRHEEAVLLRRRQHHVEPGAGEGVLPRADPARASAGSARPASTPRTTRSSSTCSRAAAARACSIGFESLEPGEPRAR